jgi:hypothetical protein
MRGVGPTSVDEPAASLIRRLRLLRRIHHVSFAVTAVAALGTCAARGAVWVTFLAATLLAFSVGLVVQHVTWRTRCPACGDSFFRRTWSPHNSWAGFPADAACGHCGFRLNQTMRTAAGSRGILTYSPSSWSSLIIIRGGAASLR